MQLPLLNPAPEEGPRPEPAADQPFYREQIAEMTRELQALLAVPGLELFMQTRELPAAFFGHLNAALACYDRLIEFATRFDGSARDIQCKKGCCNCCIDLVRGIFTAEIINIYHFVRAWPDVREVFEYHRESAERFMEILASMLRPGESSFGELDPRIVEAHVEYNRLERPCGFLDTQTGCCRIYPVRPIACRYFFSLDPPETCTPSHERYLRRHTRFVHLPVEIHRLLMEVGHRLGFRPLNYLSGAFCGFAAEVMRSRPIKLV